MNEMPQPVPASLGKRFLGQLVDNALPVLLVVPGYGITIAGVASLDEGTIQLGSILAWIGAALAVALGLYQWHGIATRGQSIGKRITGTRVVDADTGEAIGWGRALLRFFVLAVMGNLCLVPLLIQLFVIPGHPRRQGWHDSAARTVVLLAQGTATTITSPRGGRTETTDGTDPVAAPPATATPEAPAAPASFAPPSLATGATTSAGPPPPSSPSSDPAPAPVAPPPAAAVPVPPPPVSAPPGAPAPVAPVTPAAPAVPAGTDHVEHTVLVDRSGPSAPVLPTAPPAPPVRVAWSLVGDDGSRIEVTDAVVVGRAPDAALVADAVPVPVADPQRTMSKTHAVLRVTGDELTVEDLASTNGVYLVDTDSETRLPSGAPTVLTVGRRLTFGDRAYVVERDA